MPGATGGRADARGAQISGGEGGSSGGNGEVATQVSVITEVTVPLAVTNSYDDDAVTILAHVSAVVNAARVSA